MADWLEPGTLAPDFTLTADDSSRIKLSSFRGQPVVLYFYPRDDTPGCTREACGFRDITKDLSRRKATVLGVSPDDVASHLAFRKKYRLPFHLLADPDHRVAEKYGAWREKTLYGKKRLGIARSTFVIDPAGRIVKLYKAVKVDGHADQVLRILDTVHEA